MHIHAVEEVLEVMEGRAEITLGDTSHIVTPDQSVVIPAGMRHGFKNVGEGILKVRATLAASIFEASYDDGREQSGATARKRSIGTSGAGFGRV